MKPTAVITKSATASTSQTGSDLLEPIVATPETRASSRIVGDVEHGQRSPWALLARALLACAGILLGGCAILLSTIRPGPRPANYASWALTFASRLLLRALDIRLVQRGRPRPGASLVVANNICLLDVLVLTAAGAMHPVVSAEVEEWPVIGGLVRRSGALFVNRERLRELPVQVDKIVTSLRQGNRVQVFPEVSTQGGTTMAPFHRAAFQAAIDAAVVISPVAIAYRDAAGRPAFGSASIDGTKPVVLAMKVLRARGMTVEANWLATIPAIVATGTPAIDRARVAAAAERAIGRALRSCAPIAFPENARNHPVSVGGNPVLRRVSRTGNS